MMTKVQIRPLDTTTTADCLADVNCWEQPDRRRQARLRGLPKIAAALPQFLKLRQFTLAVISMQLGMFGNVETE